VILDLYTTLGPTLANHARQPLRPLADATTAERLLAILDGVAIDSCVTFAPLWRGGPVHDPEYTDANAAVAEAVQAHPDRIIGYARVNPNYGARAVALARRCFDEYGFRGLMLDTGADNVEPSDPDLVHPLVELAAERGLPVLVESGWSPISPAVFWPLAEAFPDTPIVLAHLGGRLIDDAVGLCHHAANVYLETSDHMHLLGQVVKAVGADRILFGSNVPFSAPEAELMKVTIRPDLTDEQKALILGGNAARLHGLNGRS
jgi:uncharacterized protein